MNRLRRVIQQQDSYEPLEGGSETPDGEQIEQRRSQTRFSWIDYGIFLVLGVAMLWAWNMFLAAGPYFQRRFASNERILSSFQSAELAVSTLANLGSMVVLTKLQANANYPKRVITSLSINLVVFTLLAISTRVFLGITAGTYLGFLIVMVLTTSLATGLMQNGVFAYVGGLGQEEYTQAIMTGQGIAGVLPCVVQIASVLSVPTKAEGDIPQESTRSAFAYFLTATGVSAITLGSFFLLLSRHGLRGKGKHGVTHENSEDDPMAASTASLHVPIPLTQLFRKLFWLVAAVFLTFAVTMFYPVFTQQIQSVRPVESSHRLFQPSAFIPLAFLFWNSGDLIGRVLPAIPRLNLTKRPPILFVLAVVRILWIPLYLLCNNAGKGAVIQSDLFYLVIVQFLFGMSNGYVGSSCMMGFVEWVLVEEREAAGGFMSLCLVAGLSTGSLLSFLVGGIS